MVQLQQHDLQAQKNNSSQKTGVIAPYVKIPASDILWISAKKPSTAQLFLDAWASDPYGSRYVKLQHNLKTTAFRQARKLLTEQGLFIFKRDCSILDPRATNCWMVKNLHGARSVREDNAAPALEDIAIAPEDNEPAIISVTPTPPILPQTPIEPALPETSLSIHNFSNQQDNYQQNIAVEKDEVVIEDDNDSQPTQEETREALTTLRNMGLRLNPTIQALVLKYYSRVPSALAHIKERIAGGERFKNLEGAFVQAVKHNAQPQRTCPTWGYHAEINPPSSEQLAMLDEAKASGLIRDYYLSSDNICKVVHERLGIMPWWDYLCRAEQAT